jgi:hypothetical protein
MKKRSYIDRIKYPVTAADLRLKQLSELPDDKLLEIIDEFTKPIPAERMFAGMVSKTFKGLYLEEAKRRGMA